MYELTIGELRYINESTTIWKMLTQRVKDSMGQVPSEITEKLRESEKAYIEELRKYYIDTKEQGTNKNSDEIAAEFDDLWVEKHPDFYDMRKLFAECNSEELAKAEDAFRFAEDYYGRE